MTKQEIATVAKNLSDRMVESLGSLVQGEKINQSDMDKRTFSALEARACVTATKTGIVKVTGLGKKAFNARTAN